MADSLRAVGVSKALVRAAEDSAEPRAVPHPAQIESVVLGPHLQLKILLGIVGSVAVLVAGPAHLRRRRLITEHWTAHYEQTAWGHARNRAVSTTPRAPRSCSPG